MSRGNYDAIVIGAGPNGLAAAIRLQSEGLSVLLLEGKDMIGGGTRTEQLTLPGYWHDVCSAVHPMARMSPYFTTLPLSDFGLEWLVPEVSAAHPFDNGLAAALYPSLALTAAGLGQDADAYRRFMEPVIESIPRILPGLLGPFPDLRHPLDLAGFGWKALPPASWTATRFKGEEARGLWGGMAAHAIQPLENWITSAIGLMLMAASHVGGWSVPKGGSKAISNALAEYFRSLGGEIQTGVYVKSLDDLPGADAILLDVTPKQLLEIAGNRLSPSYRKRLERYRYGMGVFKIDWALSEPIPFTAGVCRKAGTIHLGGTYEEIASAEKNTSRGRIQEKPFVLLAQPSITDTTRAPLGRHIGWAYCHVPNGCDVDMTTAIEQQVERFAPGFRDTILARHTLSATAMEQYNPNYVGGDINGGIQDIYQHFSRPVLSFSPYRTSTKGIYLCSSSTPPGGGVHGMCGFHAAERALKDEVFR
jgi:phytoene dehydrogenase-like protein